MSTRTTGKRITYDQMDLATRMAEREWKHSQKSPNIPMSVKAEIRAEFKRVARQIRRLKQAHKVLAYHIAINDVLALLKEARR